MSYNQRLVWITAATVATAFAACTPNQSGTSRTQEQEDRPHPATNDRARQEAPGTVASPGVSTNAGADVRPEASSVPQSQ